MPETHDSKSNLRWSLDRFDSLTPDSLYALLEARVAVFVVEQHCPYQEIDGLDRVALHLAAWRDQQLAAAARILPPGVRFDEPSIGRVLTCGGWRGTGLGRELMRRALDVCVSNWPDAPVRVSAQSHLQRFYGSLGFAPCSLPYDEDGIPHIDMLRPAA